jgi:mRNA interferase MazF
VSSPQAITRMNRGEIWLLDWSPGRGSEQTGVRPALIVQNDPGNHSPVYPNTMVASITTRGRNIPFHVLVLRSPVNGLKVDSYIKCEQVLTVSKARLLGSAWGRLTDVEMAQVDVALKLSLGLK